MLSRLTIVDGTQQESLKWGPACNAHCVPNQLIYCLLSRSVTTVGQDTKKYLFLSCFSIFKYNLYIEEASTSTNVIQETVISEREEDKGVFLCGPEWKVCY